MNAEARNLNGNGSPHVQQVALKQEPAAPGGGAAGHQDSQEAGSQENPKKWGARSVDQHYTKVNQIGEGQYGQVCIIWAYSLLNG